MTQVYSVLIVLCILISSGFAAEVEGDGTATAVESAAEVFADAAGDRSLRLAAVEVLAAGPSTSVVRTRLLEEILTGSDLFFRKAAALLLGIEIERKVETIEFSVSDFCPTLRADNRHTPLATHEGNMYFVWADSQRRPMVARIDESTGSSTVKPLDHNPDYRIFQDPHNRLSLGVDKNGYIHITADMHNYPHFQQGSLPNRYRYATILYWVSEQPEDISSFRFMGHSRERAIPGYGFSYHQFIVDNHGELFFTARVGGYHTRAVGLYRYDVDSRRWTALGGIPSRLAIPGWLPTHPRPQFLFWVPYGAGDHRYYQGYMTNLMFDHNNRMHFAVAVNGTTDVTVSGYTHLVYAYSDDGGNTFYRADGTAIALLPMGIDCRDSQADIVDQDLRLGLTPAAPFFDYFGAPAVAAYGLYWYYDAAYSSWLGPISSPVGMDFWGVSNFLDRHGVITFVSGRRLHRTVALDPSFGGVDYHIVGGLHSVDQRVVREQNAFRGVSVSGSVMSIKTVRFVPRTEAEILADFRRSIQEAELP